MTRPGEGGRGLRGATVVIAGASCGMGLATALAFARRGSNLVLAARREEELQKAAARCQALGTKAVPVVADVTDPAAMQALSRAATARFGGIDVWINMAGLSLWGRFEDIPPEAQTQLIRINLDGVINGSHAAVRAMLAGGGVIINMASFAGRVPVPFSAAYTASKYGVAGFSAALRDELAGRSRIKVSAVFPTFVNTPSDLHSANYTGHVLRPLPPVIQPEEVAERVVKLALRPRRTLHLGAQHALAPGYMFAPESTGRLVGRLLQRFLLHSGPPAQDSEGILFGPMASGTGTRGRWDEYDARVRATAASVAVVGGLAGAAGIAALFVARSGRARNRRAGAGLGRL